MLPSCMYLSTVGCVYGIVSSACWGDLLSHLFAVFTVFQSIQAAFCSFCDGYLGDHCFELSLEPQSDLCVSLLCACKVSLDTFQWGWQTSLQASKFSPQPSILADASDPNTWKAKAGWLPQVWGQLGQPSEFKASLGHGVRLNKTTVNSLGLQYTLPLLLLYLIKKLTVYYKFINNIWHLCF